MLVFSPHPSLQLLATSILSMASPPDFYRVLGVAKDSSAEEIRKAYKLLARKWHPDKHPVSSKQEAEAQFKAITQAYEALSDNEYRRMSSVRGHSERIGKGINEEQAKRKPPPVEMQLECTLEELCWGCKKDVQVSRDLRVPAGLVMQKPETRTITIKPGWKKGTRITFEGMGVENSDVIFSIVEKKHPIFKRVGDDLVLKAEVPLVDALVGTWTFSFRLLGGRKMCCPFRDDIIFPGYEKVIKGQGMPRGKGDGSRGDLIIKFRISFPRKLSKEQQLGIAELLREK